MPVSIRVNASVRTGGPYAPGTAASPTRVTIPVTFERPALPLGCLFTNIFFYQEGITGPFTGPLGNSFSGQSLRLRTAPFRGAPFIVTTQQPNTPAPGYFTETAIINVFNFSQTEVDFRTYVTSDPSIPKTLELNWNHTGQFIGFELTDLYMVLWTDDPCAPTGGGGDDDDDDDDEIPNGPSAGLYRAIKADQARGWLHVGNEAAVDTKHIVPGSAAFSSGSHGVKWWKQFDVDERSGTLFLLGRSVTDGFSKLFTSSDGGLSIEEILNVECNSVVMKYDSQNKWLVVLTEADPPAPSDPNSNGVVSMRISRNNGESFESPVTCEYLTGSLSARLLGMDYAEREGAELFLLCQIGAQKKLLSSTDGGKKWEARIA
jgi:hypothetical protein